MRRLHRLAPCKVNLLLNVLGRRADGFHELETLIQPVPIHDELEFERGPVSGFQLTCNDPRLPVDARNLVHRAATAFLSESGIAEGIHIHLEKRIPMEAGLGGGSGNAAHTLLGLNELFDRPLGLDALCRLGAALGSDVVCFLDPRPALATGRGESVEWVEPFASLRGCGLFLVHPGFGVSTPWAYQALARHPEAVAGKPGRARQLVECLRQNDCAHGGGAVLQRARGAGAFKIPAVGVLSGVLAGRRGDQGFDVREWISHLRADGKSRGRRTLAGAGQVEVWRGMLDRRGATLARGFPASRFAIGMTPGGAGNSTALRLVGPDRCNTLESDFHRLDVTLVVEFHAIDADHPMVSIGFTERSTVIDDIILVLAWQLNDGMMPGPGGHGRVLLEDLANPLEWSQRRVRDRVGHRIIRPGPSALGPHEIVSAVAHEHEMALRRNPPV